MASPYLDLDRISRIFAHGRDADYEDNNISSNSTKVTDNSAMAEQIIAANSQAAEALSSLIGAIGQNPEIKFESLEETPNCTSTTAANGEVAHVAVSDSDSNDIVGVIDCGFSADDSPAANSATATVSCKSEELDSGDDVPEYSEGAPIHEIRCGLLTGRLHMQRFTCPGIHRKCVEFEGKLISPRQFTIKAEKDKQKDWKGSIRLGKHNLRTLMEMKTLDFYEHATNCSLKCQSRNYIKNRKTEVAGNCESTTASLLGGIEEAKSAGMGSTSGEAGGAFSFGVESESNDPQSTPSSSVSTRKSSAVLEDYISQTIPSVANGHHFGGVALREGVLDELNGLQNSSTQQPATTSSSGGAPQLCNSDPMPSAPASQLVVSNSSSGISSFASTPPSFPALSLLQQSPLKQLFGSPPPPQNPQHQQKLFPQVVGSPLVASRNGGDRPKLPQQHSTLVPELPQESTLALLLQSLQKSILMEQQHKLAVGMANNNNNNNHGNGLSSLLSAAQMQSSPLMGFNNGTQANNGIERLLAAAALFPQYNGTPNAQPHSQQKTPTMAKQELINGGGTAGANVRKMLEENAVLFWSQMRQMGLLEDMLNTLSVTLERLKQIYLTGGNVVSEEFSAIRLSGVAIALDLCTQFGDKIHNRCIQATLETSLITKELQDLQRKQEEQKRKLETVKRKSQVLELLKNGSSAPAAAVGANNSGENAAPELKKIHLNI